MWDSLVRHLCATAGVAEKEVRSPGRNAELTYCRHLIAWAMRQNGLSYNQIGIAMYRDHSSIIQGVRRIDRLLLQQDDKTITMCEVMRLGLEGWRKGDAPPAPEVPELPQPTVVAKEDRAIQALTFEDEAQSIEDLCLSYARVRRQLEKAKPGGERIRLQGAQYQLRRALRAAL